MNKLLLLAKKDFKQLFFSFTGFICVLLLPFLLSFWTIYVSLLFSNEQAELSSFFGFYTTLLIFIVPVLTIKLSIDDNRFKTNELIFTLPFSEFLIISSRFLAVLAMFLLIYASTFLFPMVVSHLGNFDTGKIISNFTGIFVNALASISIVLLISTMVRGSVLSLILSILVLSFLNSSTGSDLFLSLFTFAGHMEGFSRGILKMSDILYFLYISLFSLYLSSRILVLRRWAL